MILESHMGRKLFNMQYRATDFNLLQKRSIFLLQRVLNDVVSHFILQVTFKKLLFVEFSCRIKEENLPITWKRYKILCFQIHACIG